MLFPKEIQINFSTKAERDRFKRETNEQFNNLPRAIFGKRLAEDLGLNKEVDTVCVICSHTIQSRQHVIVFENKNLYHVACCKEWFLLKKIEDNSSIRFFT